MGKLRKIMLSCACAVFVIAIIGFGIWKMTYTSPGAASSQNSSLDNMDSTTGRNQYSSVDNGTDSIKITAPDGSELIIVNPPLQDNHSNIEYWITNFDHTENEDAYTEMPVD